MVERRGRCRRSVPVVEDGGGRQGRGESVDGGKEHGGDRGPGQERAGVPDAHFGGDRVLEVGGAAGRRRRRQDFGGSDEKAETRVGLHPQEVPEVEGEGLAIKWKGGTINFFFSSWCILN